MRYTGLLDINGVKIYECSIVKNLNVGGSTMTVFLWDYGLEISGRSKTMWSAKNTTGKVGIETVSDHPSWGCIVIDVMEESISLEQKEVIENIYKYSELLN